MRYIFLIFKLKSLERLRKAHMLQYDSWVSVTAKYREGTFEFEHGVHQYRYHKSEVMKIENLIKLIS